jgi:hypothetical protein
MLESNLNAVVGKQTDGQDCVIPPFFFCSPEFLKAIDPGGSGQSPREILYW